MMRKPSVYSDILLSRHLRTSVSNACNKIFSPKIYLSKNQVASYSPGNTESLELK
jgi:hypothetical protein